MSPVSQLNKPAPLRPGDRVGLFVPSSPVREPYRGNGLAELKRMGLVPVEVPHIMDRVDFTAKSPQAVVADLQAFFSAADIHALWAVRGGYGANLLLPYLETLEIPRPKIVIGSSDVSILLWWLLENRRMVVFFGPMAFASLADNAADTAQCRSLLDGSRSTPVYEGKPLIPGQGQGRLTGGCLTNLVSLIGTPWFPRLRNRILLLEDVAERPYSLHRLFWHLAGAGCLRGVRGIALGEFPGCFKDSREREALWQRLVELFAPMGVPVMTDLPLGHARQAQMIPLGTRVSLEVDRDTARLRLKEPGTVAQVNG
ncbi:MAG: LD-carboxypeptidase [Acidobacteriota bacterium]|jgi:muramoyltetrapeptide carboxypeptidase|nr:LD-carboxypeptidase [Acidobacteriota bacterium]